MGYPMTFQRVLHRSGLNTGNYGQCPPRAPFWGVNEKPEALATWLPELSRRVADARSWAMNLAGDLRRLEEDAVDEAAICTQIATRTGLPRDVVAAVLKEFIAL